MINLELYLDHDRLEKTCTKNWCNAQIRDTRIIKTIHGLGHTAKREPIKHSPSFCRRFLPAVWSAAPEEAAWRPCGEARRPPAPSTGLCASAPRPRTYSAANPPAQHSAGLAVGETGNSTVGDAWTMQERVRAGGGRWRSVPGFEVDDSQRTSKESSPVSTPPSEDRVDEEMILFVQPCLLFQGLILFTWPSFYPIQANSWNSKHPKILDLDLNTTFLMDLMLQYFLRK